MSVRHTLYRYTLALFFLTIVLGHKYVDAKPHGEVPSKKEDFKEKADYLDLKTQDIEVSPVPNFKMPKSLYYSYTQSISLRFGTTYNPKGAPPSGKNNLVFSGLYMFKKFTSPQVEVGADLANNNTGFFHAGIRHIYNNRSFFRQFLKYGIGVNLESPKNLASFVDFKNNYYLLLSMGIENSIWRSTSIRLELQAFVGLTNIFPSVYSGLSWAW